MKKWILAVNLLLVSYAVAQQAPPVLRGSWIATAGSKRTFQGRWSAQVLPPSKNVALGSWTLLGENNQIVLEGTWSARKLADGWQGTWTARIEGRTVSGMWNAVMTDFNGKTFEDMLKRTAERANWRLLAKRSCSGKLVASALSPQGCGKDDFQTMAAQALFRADQIQEGSS
jgi:hypothetical protein